MSPIPPSPNSQSPILPSAPIPVAILGATGTVGQRFISLLDGHPWFRVVALTGSERRAGQRYGKAVHWLLSSPLPAWAAGMPLLPTDPASLNGVALAFSALPSDVAREVEPQLAARGIWVCSNASAFRREPDVPILMPEVNADQTAVLEIQRRRRGWKAGIVTNSNCTSSGMTVTLKALDDAFGLEKVFAVSMQAISGAGYPGVASLDIVGNVIPYIGGEEAKVEWEPRKMLGKAIPEGIRLADFRISAHTNRVPVVDGHTVVASVALQRKPAGVEEAIRALEAYQPPAIARGLPSTPAPVIVVRREPDRPQPRLDAFTGRGMTTVVGRVRSDPIWDLKFVVVSHNTVRGAAGGAVYNAELLVRQQWVKPR
ncbi:MAG TPA: aspartate-semialdehyde dehydrogenase [Chloroflexi bacterium]|nr:aspartate-semialdehyde dehydrogenase [Chloroflexota bacterium]